MWQRIENSGGNSYHIQPQEWEASLGWLNKEFDDDVGMPNFKNEQVEIMFYEGHVGGDSAGCGYMFVFGSVC